MKITSPWFRGWLGTVSTESLNSKTFSAAAAGPGLIHPANARAIAATARPFQHPLISLPSLR
jgi:hypothetical protein